MRPVKVAISRKCGSVNAPAALAGWVGSTRATGPTMTLEAASAAATSMLPPRPSNRLRPSRVALACPSMDAQGYSWEAVAVTPFCQRPRGLLHG